MTNFVGMMFQLYIYIYSSACVEPQIWEMWEGSLAAQQPLLISHGSRVSARGRLVSFDTIAHRASLRPPLAYSSSKVLERHFRGLEIDARVGDADPTLEPLRSLGGHLLVAFVEMRFDHDAHDGVLASTQLVGDYLCDFRLVAVIFVRVACKGSVCVKRDWDIPGWNKAPRSHTV